MKYTSNKNLRLPEDSDVIDIENFNVNFNIADEHMEEKTSDMIGAHGLRYNETDKTLEVLSSEGIWIKIK